MPNIPKLIQSIDSGRYSQKELIALYNNTNKNKTVSDREKEQVIDRIIIQLREHYPRAAKKLLGPVGSRPQEILEALYTKADTKFDLTDNTVKNGIKAGGAMISGDAPVDWYVSYKDKDKNGVVAGAIQHDLEEPVVYRVFRYTGASRPENRFKQSEFVGESPDFEETYIELLGEVLKKAA